MPQYSRYQPGYSSARPQIGPAIAPSQKRRFFRLPLFITLVFGVIIFGAIAYANHASAESNAAAQVAALQAAKSRSAVFKRQVLAVEAANPSVTISVVVHSDLLGQQYFGTPGGYDGASTGKLITASDYLHHVETGKASLNQMIDGETAQSWLQAMIVNSDDTAWAELNGFLGHQDLANYASNIGLSNYDPTDNNFSAGDIASLLYQLQAGTLLNHTDQQLMLSYLKVANYRQYIVPAIPSDYTVYHKVGLDNDNVHDAAIIGHNGQTIELVIFTNGNGTYDWPDRAALMQSITRDALKAYLPQ